MFLGYVRNSIIVLGLQLNATVCFLVFSTDGRESAIPQALDPSDNV